MPKAKDIMTANPLMLGSGTELLEAVHFFNQNGISSAPVQSPLGEVLGQLTEMDLLKAVVHHKAQGSKYSKVAHAHEYFEPVHYVDEESDLGAVIKKIVKSPTHRILVRDYQSRVVGIISPKDLLRNLFGDEKVSTKIVEEMDHLHKELEELRDRLKEMSLYLNTYDSVFHSGLYMLHSVDHTGRIIFANERLHQALGYEPGELIGKTIYDLYPKEVHAEARTGLKRVMTQGKHRQTFSRMLKRSGDFLPVDLASAALRDEYGHFLGTFTISREYDADMASKPLDGVFQSKE